MTYGDSPWVFKGRALYQLQLVKSHEARKYIPDDFKLVELFGYTLGGLYLARYSDSPTGAFDEMVTLAGLVWNAPTSCAWAARVYVNNREARDHGLAHVGLPSRLTSFLEAPHGSDAGPEGGAPGSGSASKTASSKTSWWRQTDSADTGGLHLKGPGDLPLVIRNVDTTRGRGLKDHPVCSLGLPPARPASQWAGPRINLALPSFSGGTPEHPRLLQYTCSLNTNVRPVSAAKVILPAVGTRSTDVMTKTPSRGPSGGSGGPSGTTDASANDGGELMHTVLGGFPVLALAFDNMEMTVLEPTMLESRVTAPSRLTSSVTA